MVELSTLPDGGLVQAADLFVISRGGAARRVSGSRFVLTDSAGSAVLPGNPQMPADGRLRAGTAPLLSGNGASTTLFSGTTALYARNAADTATLLTLSNAGLLSLNGGVEAGGAIRQNGNQVWHAGNLNPSSYMPLSGGTFTGPVYVVSATDAGLLLSGALEAGNYAGVDFKRTAGTVNGSVRTIAQSNNDYGTMQFFTRAADGFAERMRLRFDGNLGLGTDNPTQRLTVAGAVSATGAITQGGNQVWHAGNFAPSQYMPKFGGVFTGDVFGTAFRAGSTTVGSVAIVPGSNAATGFVTFRNATDNQLGYIGAQGFGAPLIIQCDAGIAVQNPLTAPSLATTGSITQGGNQVWHAGNFNPSNYATTTALAGKQNALGYTPANRAGDTFTGAVSGPSFAASGAVSGASMTVGGSAVWHAGNFTPSNYAPLGGAAFTGGISAPTVTAGINNHYIGASGGNPLHVFDADDYIVFDRAANTFRFYVAGAQVMNVDGAGNVRARGNFTGNLGNAV